MKFAKIIDRLQGLGADKWAVHLEGKERAASGQDVIFLSIGEPDAAPPQAILDVAASQMNKARMRYSSGQGEQNVLDALSRHYTKQTGRVIGADQFLFLPGTQTALSVAFLSIIEAGDEVMMFDPYYATYEGLVRLPGGVPVPVPLDPDRGFHPDLKLFEAAITPRTKAILLNSPSNPTGAVFNADEIKTIGEIAAKHDLWIVSDEVYATLVHGNHVFTSPFFDAALEPRVIVCSSVSKSHALPGFRCGWIAASAEFCAKAVPVAESLLFGSPQFLQDAVAFALDTHFVELDQMQRDYQLRAIALLEGLAACKLVSARMPEGGMFVMVDIRKTGKSGEEFARALLRQHNVVTMPGESFGACGAGHLRVALTVDEVVMKEAAHRIAKLASSFI
jgi:arginine:pyruvate transaminase